MSGINTAREADAGASAAGRSGVQDQWCILLVGLTWVAVWYRQLLLSLTTFVGDTAWVFFPLRALGAARLHEGELGLWNPHVFGGVPFAADPQSQVFYPSHLALAFLSVPGAMSASLALHSLLLLAGTYVLGRYSLRLRPVSAAVVTLAFGLCAPALHRTTIPVYPEALAWLPWAIVALDWSLRDGRWTRLWSPTAVVSVQLMAGAPQYTYYTLIAMAGVAVWRVIYGSNRTGRVRAALALPMVLAGAALLSAIQIVPAIEMVRLSQRAADLGYGFSTYGSLPIRAFGATLLFPHLYGTCLTREVGGFQMHWHLGYVGVMTLGLALVGACLSPRRRQVWWLLVFVGVTLAVATGGHNPFFPLLFRVLPGVGLFRNPCLAIVLTDLGVAVLAGLGMEAAWALGGPRRWLAVGLAVGPAAGAAALAPWAISVADPLLPITFELWPWLQVGIAAAGSLVVALLVVAARRQWLARALALVALAFLAADLVIFTSATDIATVVPNEVLVETPESVVFHRATRPLDRLWDIDRGIALRKYLSEARSASMSEMEYRVAAVPGILEALPSDLPAAYQVDGLDGAWGAMLPLRRHVPPIYQGPPGPAARQWLDLLAVAYFADRGARDAPTDCPVVLSTQEWVLLHENPSAAPRAFWCATAVPVRDYQTAISLIEREIPFPYREKVYIETAGQAADRMPAAGTPETTPPLDDSGEPRSAASASVTIATKAAERVVLTVRSAADGWAVISDNYYPGWHARLDGAEVPLFPANAVMRAVRVPRGEHRVEMRFDSESLRLGGFISLVGLALLAGTLCAQAMTGGASGRHSDSR